jgi:hypothetical protein
MFQNQMFLNYQMFQNCLKFLKLLLEMMYQMFQNYPSFRTFPFLVQCKFFLHP